MAVCASLNNQDNFVAEPSVPLDQCLYFILDASDWAVHQQFSPQAFYELAFVGLLALMAALAVLAGRQRSF